MAVEALGQPPPIQEDTTIRQTATPPPDEVSNNANIDVAGEQIAQSDNDGENVQIGTEASPEPPQNGQAEARNEETTAGEDSTDPDLDKDNAESAPQPVTLNSVSSLVIEGISSVTIYQTEQRTFDSYYQSPMPPPPPPPGAYNYDSTLPPNPDEPVAPEPGTDPKGSRIKFTVQVQDLYGNLSPQYQSDKPSTELNFTRRSNETTYSNPVLEQLISLKYSPIPTGLSQKTEEDLDSIHVMIHSPFLINALRSVIQYYSTEGMMTSIFKIQHPYPFLFHHKQELIDYKSCARPEHSPEYNEECDKHIDVLINYLNNYSGLHLDEEVERWNRNTPVVTFQNLWLLFKPGEDVYVRDTETGDLNAYVIKSVMGSESNARLKIPSSYSLTVWNLNFDGKWFGRSSKTVWLTPFEGERDITSLNVFPTRFYKDKEGEQPFEEFLVERGKKFYEMCKGPAYREYTGSTLTPPRRKYNRARVMIDNSYEPWTKNPSFIDFAPNVLVPIDDNIFIPGCQCDACQVREQDKFTLHKVKFSDYDYVNVHEVKTLTRHQYMLCSPHIFGYLLKDRRWHLLDVANINPPVINEKAIDRLVMSDDSDKRMIKAICQQYTSHSQGADSVDDFSPDIIGGKGEGHIFLLHGPPGTGKTLTAECVAEYTRRPLISITAGDLGSEPGKLEANLDEFFRQGTDWDAIVLLDEADVYLEARRSHDLERNSIVSVFLRSLEYYQGILFITTNRIGSFDEAFASRIHVQLQYKKLDEKARAAVWENNFHRLKEDGHRGGQPVYIDRDAKDYVMRSAEVRDLAWNGREIRNGFQTAIALAVYEAAEGEVPVLKEDHLAKVVRMSSAFKQYVKDMYNMSLEERAHAQQVRAPDTEVAQGPERSMGSRWP